MKNFLFLFVVALFACQPSSSDGQTKTDLSETASVVQYELLSPAAFSQKLAQIPAGRLLDVRTAREFSAGTIPQSANLDVLSNDFQAGAASLDSSQPIYLYCKSGIRSAKAVRQLKDLGFVEIYELKGGMLAWKAANLPVEMPE